MFPTGSHRTTLPGNANDGGATRARRFVQAALCLLALLTPLPTSALNVCEDNGGAGWFMPATADPGAGQPGEFVVIDIPFALGPNAIVLDMNVEMDIDYPWVGDIRANLISPTGTNVTLFDRPRTTAVNHRAPWGCSRDHYRDVVFDDESTEGTIEAARCAGFPVYRGDYEPHIPGTLANFDEEALDGTWTILIEDAVFYDQGRTNYGCLDLIYANLRFDQWVSTDPACGDQLENLAVPSGTDVYYCYEVENTGERQFVIPAGGTGDDLGHDLTALETTYAPGAVETVVVGPLTTGVDLPQGTTTQNATVTAEGDDADFPATITISDTQTTELDVTVSPETTIVLAVSVISDPINGTLNPVSMPGAILRYTITVENIGLGESNPDTVVISDFLPPETRLVLGNPMAPVTMSPGAEPSGLSLVATDVGNDLSPLASGGDQINLSNDGGSTFLAPGSIATDGNDIDATLPAIDFIQVRLSGTMNADDGAAPYPGFVLTFDVRVE